MPELPEAETIVRDLDRRVRGARFLGADVIHHDVLAPGLTAAALDAGIRDHRIERVFRRGKNVVLALEPAAWLMINLGMSGRVVAAGARRAADLRHIAVRFELDRGGALLYDDTRRFGRIDLLDADAWARRDAELGIEPLSLEFTGPRLFELTRKSRVPLRNWLLDQRKLAGVGNIYANEALFRAGVRPTRRALRLTRAEADRLAPALRDVLQQAIEARGTTFSAYRDAEGEAGAFEPRLRVYGREGLPCPVCGTPIKRVVISNRSAFYCPHDQR